MVLSSGSQEDPQDRQTVLFVQGLARVVILAGVEVDEVKLAVTALAI